MGRSSEIVAMVATMALGDKVALNGCADTHRLLIAWKTLKAFESSRWSYSETSPPASY